MKVNRITVIGILLLFATAFFIFGLNKPIQAQQGDSSQEIISKINQVLSGQQEIVQKLETLQSQLNQIQMYTNKL